MKNWKKKNWEFIRIFDTNKFVVREYKDGFSGDWYHESIKEQWLKWEDENVETKRGLIRRKTIDFPASRKVTLKNPEDEEVEIIITSNKNQKLFELLENFHCGYRLSDRQRKYLNLYIVYEALSTTKDPELKAIRNSFSHSRKNLNQKQTVTALTNLFGDLKIDLKKYKHKKVFNEKYKSLLSNCSELLISEIMQKVPMKPNFLDKYYII